jgi:predicted NBD/HSP70 family sugar kinase
VVLENDANAAGYAEHRYGAARDLATSVYVTLSTGIGGGVFVGEEVLRGANGLAGEIGHMVLLPGGPTGGDGHPGTWEALAAGRAIARDASYVFSRPVSTEEAFALARGGDRRALSIVDQACRFTGLALANLVKVVDPAGFVLGGGMTAVGSFYLDRVRRRSNGLCRATRCPSCASPSSAETPASSAPPPWPAPGRADRHERRDARTAAGGGRHLRLAHPRRLDRHAAHHLPGARPRG